MIKVSVIRVISSPELAILNRLPKGYSFKQIASSLAICNNTVPKHCHHIYNKLYLSCGTETVVKALKLEIVDL